MAKLIRFPSIEQYRKVLHAMNAYCEFHGIRKPQNLKFRGTVKMHGTNAGVALDLLTGEVYAQSREKVIVPGDDNAGFAAFVAERLVFFRGLLERIGVVHRMEGASHVVVYGEWCGKGTVKGKVALTQLERKRFVIFGMKVVEEGGGLCMDSTDEESAKLDRHEWLTEDECRRVFGEAGGCAVGVAAEPWVFLVGDFPTWELEIDFNRPEIAQNEMVRLTAGVEAECPVGKAFGVEGVGEGIVWEVKEPWLTLSADKLRFKVKGAKHSDTKTTTTAEVDVEKVATSRAFAEVVVTDHRLEKMVAKMEEGGKPLLQNNLGVFLRLVCADVLKEEEDRLKASGLVWKETCRYVEEVAKKWWKERLAQV